MYFFPYVRREWTEYRCPNGHLVARQPNDRVTLGDPCVRCRECGLETRIDAFREWVHLTREQRRVVVVGHVLNVLFSGGALGVVIGATVAVIGMLAGLSDDTLIALGVAGFAIGLCVPAAWSVVTVHSSKERSALRVGVTSH